MYEDYVFIPVVELCDRTINVSELEHNNVKVFFINKEDEVIYILKNKRLVRIITPGVLYRYYLSEKISPLYNSKFSYVC